MPDSVQDNRKFYRIEDRVALEFCLTDEKTVYDDSARFPITIDPHFQLLNQLRTIDSKHSQVLRSIGEKDRNLAAYLKGTEQKIELLAQTLMECDENLTNEHLKTITLSEGGLSFYHYDSIETDRFIAFKLTLVPTCIGLLMFGKVVNYSSDNSGNHLINISFKNMSESNRALIARHVLLFQAKQRHLATAQT